jgi:thiol-disulfide isomerase/thioredoxin
MKPSVMGVWLMAGIPCLAAAQQPEEQEPWKAKYPFCMDYMTVGTGLCAPQPSPTEVVTSTLLAPRTSAPTPKNKVDEFLDNYGKPPREFVEFYLDPSPDNAKKWATKYQGMVEKARTIANVWNGAEKSLVSNTITDAPAPIQPKPEILTPVTPVVSTSVDLSSRNDIGQLGVTNATVKVAYFYSADCPYCAQMTPALDQLVREMGSRLELTCIDMTPNNPQPNTILGKLSCTWRLPKSGEIATRQITQTPTLLYSVKGGAEHKLSGYVPLENLREYLK